MGSEGSPRGGQFKGCQEESNFSCSRGIRVRRVGAQKERQCEMGGGQKSSKSSAAAGVSRVVKKREG